jgi:transcriptional regulator with XRE-family HTH domain
MKNRKEFRKKIGKNLRKFRLARGFTQEDLAEKMGVKQCQLSQYELGVASFAGAKLKDIANILKVSIEDLLDVGEE